ncbi:glycosyltransferase [Bdellovibrionota bacterium FG-2]
MLTARRDQIIAWGLGIYAVLSLGSMATMSIGAVVVLCALIAGAGGPLGLRALLKAELTRSASRRYLAFSGLLVFAYVLSLLFAKWAPLEVGGRVSEVFFFKEMAKGWYLFWPLFLVVGLRALPAASRKSVFWAWMIAYAVVVVIGDFQHFTGWPRPQHIPGLEHRFHSTLFFGHHLSVASILIFPFFVGLDRLLLARSDRMRWAFGVLAAAGAFVLFATYSRTLWIALPLGLLIWISWSLPKKISLPLALVFVLGGIAVSQHPVISARMHHALGVATRKELWEANFEFFKARLFTGVGWHHNIELSGFYLMSKHGGASVFSGHAHNNFLDYLGGTGLLGTVSWFAWCVFVGVLFWKTRLVHLFSDVRGRGLFCAWIVFHINGLTQTNFAEGKVLHQLMWVVAWALLGNEVTAAGVQQKKRRRVVIDARSVDAVHHSFARYITFLAEGLRAKKELGYEVVFLLNEEMRESIARTVFADFPRVFCRSRFLSLAELVEIPRVLKALEADLYHSPTFASLAWAPCPWVVTIHDLNHLTYGGLFHKLYYRFLLNRFAKRAAVVCTVSKFSRAEIADWLRVAPQDIVIAYNTIDPALAEPVTEGLISGVLGKYRLEKGQYFFALSNPKPHKNVAMLVEAYSKYRETAPQAWALAVSMKEYADVPGVVALGSVAPHETRALIEGAGALVFPSLYEGFGLPPVEAAALGVPILVSEIPPHREGLVDLKAQEAVWLDPRDSEGWTRAMQQVASKGGVRTSVETRRAILSRFSAENLGATMDRIYNSL